MNSAKRMGILIALGVVVALITAITLGSVPLHWTDAMEPGSVTHRILWQLRVPRAVVAFSAGAGLALAGLVFQALYLNRLATPFTLGIATGASFGASLSIWLTGVSGALMSFSTPLGAMLGAACSVAIVWGFGRTRAGHERQSMLLAGVAVSFFFSSMILLVQAVSSYAQSFQIIRWLMGGIAVVGYREVTYLATCAGLFVWIVSRHAAALDLLLTGEELAHSRGLQVQKTKQRLFLMTSALVALVVSVTGPIGFVGLVVPHICRLWFGHRHRLLVLAVPAVGGALLVLCDTIARMVLAPTELPVGVVTSMIGAPFFFAMLLRRNWRT